MSCTQWSKSNVDNFKNCHCFGSICHCSRLCQYLIYIKLLGSVRLTKLSGNDLFSLNECQFFFSFDFESNAKHTFQKNKEIMAWNQCPDAKMNELNNNYRKSNSWSSFRFRPKSVTSSGNRWKSYLPIKRLQIHLE